MFNVRGVNGVRQTAEPLVAAPSAFEVEMMAIKKAKKTLITKY